MHEHRQDPADQPRTLPAVTDALGQAAAPAPVRHEYRIVQDVSEADLTRLVEKGWEYAGYLGEGVKGQVNDETLWHRAR